ncbi:hypothetical protein Leryth_025494 [Lithospermum erythrorhizon]|nr:hypothetical protein Leryth_025494 [Lithospermum erythrorhizon]
MRPFGEAKSISGHQTLQLMRRPYGVKGSVYVVTLPAFQRCLEDGPDAAERQPGAIPTGRDRSIFHISRHTSRPTGNTGETFGRHPPWEPRIHKYLQPPTGILIILKAGGRTFCNEKTEQI